MAFLELQNVRIAGISATVQVTVEENINVYEKWGGYDKFLSATCIEHRRKADIHTCSSDLCMSAAEKLISELKWDKSEIEVLIFVSQTPDYITPVTSCILQDKLGLSENCYVLDIALGCSGWVYALSIVSSLLQTGCMKKALLLAGDTILKFCSENDKSAYPLFGDAGTATAIEFDEKSEGMKFSFNSDGKGYKAIFIEDGGYRNPVSADSFEIREKGDGIMTNKLELVLDGMSVFSFGISKAPLRVNSLIEKFDIDKCNVDYFLFHQANLFMNEKIRKKLKLTMEQSSLCLRDFGNTICASIPLTMVTQLRNALQTKKLRHITCGFGVGLSWGSVYFNTDCIIVPDLMEI